MAASESLPVGWCLCRLCGRVVALDDMAVMAYRSLASPPCCLECWVRVGELLGRPTAQRYLKDEL